MGFEIFNQKKQSNTFTPPNPIGSGFNIFAPPDNNSGLNASEDSFKMLKGDYTPPPPSQPELDQTTQNMTLLKGDIPAYNDRFGLGPVADTRPFGQKLSDTWDYLGTKANAIRDFGIQGASQSSLGQVFGGEIAPSEQATRALSPIGQSIARGTGRTVGELFPFALGGPIGEAGSAFTAGKLAPKFASTLGGRALSEAAGQALLGGSVTAGEEALKGALHPNDFNVGDSLKNIGENAAAFGAFGAATPYVGQAAKYLMSRFSKGAQGVTEAVAQSKPPLLALPAPKSEIRGLLPAPKIAGLLQAPKPPDFIGGFKNISTPRKLTPESASDRLYRVLDEIAPEVQKITQEAKVPALESKKAMIDYISEAFPGVSRNEIRSLSPQDMQGLVMQAAKEKHVPAVIDAARQVAAKRGYNLDKLLEESTNKTPFTDRALPIAERNRLGQVAGAMDRPNIGRGPTQQVPFVEQVSKPLPNLGPLKTVNADIKPPISDLRLKGPSLPNGKNAQLGQLSPLSELRPNNAGLKQTLPGIQSNSEVAATMALPDTTTQIATKTKRADLSVPNAINTSYIKTVDNLHRLNQFDQTAESALGRPLAPTEQTHTLGLNSRGSDIISKQILTDKMVNSQGEVIGNSLKDITKQIPKGQDLAFDDYLINKHAITRMGRGEKVFPDAMGMTPEKSAAKVAEYEAQFPEFKNIADQMYEWDKQLAKAWLVDTGMIPAKELDAWVQANPSYSPMNREFSPLEKNAFTGTKKGFANQTNPVKKATGSQRPIISPIESRIEHVDKYIKAAKRNEVMQAVVGNIKKDPEAFRGWAEIVPDTSNMKHTVLKDINKTLAEEGIDGVLNKLNDSFEQGFNKDVTQRMNGGNVVSALINGEPVRVKVNDPHLLEALTNLTPQGQNVVVAAMGQLTRVMKLLTTGINPVFSLTRNVARDIPTAFISSKTTNNPLVFGKDLAGAVVSVVKNDALYKSFKNIGGGHSSSVASSRNLLAQSKEAILPQNGLIKPLLKKGLHKLENLNNALETAPRLAEYKRLAKEGNYNSKVKGLYEANDVTVNFNRYGDTTKQFDAIVPYLNAAVQGLNKTYRVYKDNPVQAVMKSFTAITIPSVLLYTMNHNDPNYQKLSNYIKDNNFLFPKGDGTFIKIPKPREVGALFGSSVERFLHQWNEQDPKAFNDFGTTLWNNFVPPSRTILHPALVDLTANKDYAGNPIVPGDLQRLSPRNQFDSRTSEVSKTIGNVLNQSPKQIDYLIKSYGGILGDLGLPATTKNSTIGETLKRQVTADPVFSNDVMNNFYDKKTKLDTATNDFKQTGQKSSDYNDRLRALFDSQSRQISELRKQQKAALSNEGLSTQQKQDKVRQLQDAMNAIAKKTNDYVK